MAREVKRNDVFPTPKVRIRDFVPRCAVVEEAVEQHPRVAVAVAPLQPRYFKAFASRACECNLFRDLAHMRVELAVACDQLRMCGLSLQCCNAGVREISFSLVFSFFVCLRLRGAKRQ